MSGTDNTDLEVALSLAILCVLGFKSLAVGRAFHPLFRIVLGVSSVLLVLGVVADVAGLGANAAFERLHAATKLAVLGVLLVAMAVNFGATPFRLTRH